MTLPAPKKTSSNVQFSQPPHFPKGRNHLPVSSKQWHPPNRHNRRGRQQPSSSHPPTKNEHQVAIHERYTSASEVGYAFQIAAESDQCLKYLGINTISQGGYFFEQCPDGGFRWQNDTFV
jgi:hypothetical protein